MMDWEAPNCGCGHPWEVHTLELGCFAGWEWNTEGLATYVGCLCRLAHVERSVR